MAEILTVGETMAVLIPKEDGGICYNREYRMRAAGAESNTAIGVCKLGHTAAFLSKVGADGPGEFILKTLRAEGVDSSYVDVEESFPTGLMFKEMGTRRPGYLPLAELCRKPSGTCRYSKENAAGEQDSPSSELHRKEQKLYGNDRSTVCGSTKG